MNKRIYTVSPFTIVFALIMACMAFVSLKYNYILFIVELSAAIISLCAAIIVDRHFRKYVDSIVKKAFKNIHGFNEEYLDRFKLPVAVTGESDDIIWYNRYFKKQLGKGKNVTGSDITSFLGSIDLSSLADSDGTDIDYDGRSYTVFANHAGNGMVFYFVDCTYYKQLEKEYEDSRTSAAIIVIDSADDLINASEEETTRIVISIEDLLQRWAAMHNALYKRLAGGRYMIIFEEKEIVNMIATKFKILDEIRNIPLDGRTATISVGIGRGCKTLRESEQEARKALEMALGRGGDQVAVRTGESYEFFGGVAPGVEKRSKVRARVISTTLAKAIIDSDKVLIMGHRFSDLDCVGASIGIYGAVVKSFSKHAHIVIDKEKSMAKALVERYESEKGGDVFISPDEALKEVTPKTLLIILDTHSQSMVESEALYTKCSSVVVIDHHRKAVNYINNSIVFYHEPSASSASEMCTELLTYIGDNTVSKSEAEALMAGIMLDTKNFVIKTGVRTFEAAAYLRQKGADNVAVKKLFAGDIAIYREKAQVVSAAQIYKSCAIAEVEKEKKEIRLIAAQSADELLTLSGIKASFVIFVTDRSTVNISARSYGQINVQIIMEKLGGGGHQTMAAVQLSDTTVENAREMLIKALDETIGN